MQNSDAIRNAIISKFPGLQNDTRFTVDDKGLDVGYNCIAWAACVDNEWWQAIPEEKRPLYSFDGVKYNWPYNAPNNQTLETLQFIFAHKSYEDCQNGDYEEGYRKICFYGTKDNITHAARQYTNGDLKGLWTSKLGRSFKIIHGTPYTIEGKEYGNVIHFMKCKWP